MVKKEIIGSRIFITQTTHYIYDSEEDYKNDKFSHSISNTKDFNKIKRYYKKLFEDKLWKTLFLAKKQ